MIRLRTPHTHLIALSVAVFGTAACTGANDSNDGTQEGDGAGGNVNLGDGDLGTGGMGTPGAGGLGSGGDSLGSSGGSPAAGGQPGGTGGDGMGTGGDGAGTGGDSGGGMSAGCGASNPPTSGDYTIMVNGKTREYTLDVPGDYDANSPYPITFGLHWRGGNSGDVVSNNYYGLKERANGSMIFVSPEGLVAMGNSGWANDQGEDVEFIALMLDRFESELCIDTSRVFATGFSYGGMFSNAIGCGLADRFTAIAPYAGSLWSGCEDGNTPIAFFGTHGTADDIVEIPNGREARDEFLSRNGCTNETTPHGNNGCVSYNGCQEPVIWCEYNDGHWWPGFASDEVWAFFSSL